ncbi:MULTISPECIES: relaxase/mobilization nuclease domain-containing protein [Acinetobacter calcoaceticus/baumannii complex]|nr:MULTISPECIES: relaxase/mobilization nuclease domain-containing protein [Acinetobacter calcoaceticus/baumannii complex]MCR6570030.1 relaxase/mobilization nuclease domain-containing protein [Acinetobacter baumannii]MDV4324118.1 relaxase/mobilization nuclease domain-containing protein [Acinetobacter baumannii]MDV4338545.1 relaxase/mobilization nuclease domain-containing protein [Acinetobacter baumannii]
MQDFEQALFPGMDQSQYRVLWIEHQDKLNEETGERRLELNFLIPNVEILTGQRLQPYYDKADRPRIDLFKKITNYEYQLHDADDPLYRQAVTTAKNLPKTVNEIKETLDIEATRAVEGGLITDRQSMKKWLLDLGLEVTRETKKSLSIKNPNDDEKARPIRLTGAIYEQDFRLTETSQQLTIAASERYRREAKQRNQSDIQRYAEYSAKRSTELEQQYRQHQNVYTAETERSNERDIAADRPDYSSNQEAAATRHDSPIARTTTADQTATSELAAVEQLEPRNSPSSQIKENPYYIEYSLDFTGMYNAYQQYLSGVRQQEQIQRHHRDGEQSPVVKKPRGEPEYSEVWDREKMELVRPDRPESAAVQQQHANSAGNQLNESRSTVIADYRAATAAAQRATEAARASLAAHSGTEQNHRRIRELQQQTSEALQPVERERKRADQYHQETTESEAIRGFIARLGEQLKTAITEPFRAISDWVKSKERDQRTIANDDLYRNREADSTIERTASKETRLSATVSRKIRGFDQTNIFKALDELDRRRELQLEQQRKNDRSYSPRF